MMKLYGKVHVTFIFKLNSFPFRRSFYFRQNRNIHMTPYHSQLLDVMNI